VNEVLEVGREYPWREKAVKLLCFESPLRVAETEHAASSSRSHTRLSWLELRLLGRSPLPPNFAVLTASRTIARTSAMSFDLLKSKNTTKFFVGGNGGRGSAMAHETVALRVACAC
jgi:hypothetical protein